MFLEADHDGATVLERIAARDDLPHPSYVLHSSPNRVHIFWRATDFTTDYVEALQKRLARELGTDPAATPASQATRLVGFMNHKYSPAHLSTIEYHSVDTEYPPAAFPLVEPFRRETAAQPPLNALNSSLDPVERARRYLVRVPPAIAGEHGDVQTFRVCCRLVRGFALEDAEALDVLSEWNARCHPPWSERDLIQKLRRARRYGREPIAALLNW